MKNASVIALLTGLTVCMGVKALGTLNIAIKTVKSEYI